MKVLEVNQVGKKYENFELEKLSFCLNEGTIIGCIGDNGAGKTTLIKIMIGLISQDCGTVFYFDKKMKGNEKLIKNKIGYIPDTIPFPDHFTVKFTEKLFKSNFNEWDQKQFYTYIDKFELPLNKKFSDMSKGMKIKWMFALVLSYYPKLLILDEATAGLDPITRDFILNQILKLRRENVMSVFMTTHILSDLEYLNKNDRILALKNGSVILNEKKDSLIDSIYVSNEQSLEKYLMELLKNYEMVDNK